MRITRKGFYTVTYDGQLLKKKDGSIRRVTSRDECYERITEDGRDGKFTINCPDREVDVGLIIVVAPPSGSFAHGDTFTLTGSGFGSDATPLAFDDFNWGSVGDDLELSPNVNWSTTSDNGPDVPRINATRAYGQNTKAGRHGASVGGTIDSGNSATYLDVQESALYVSIMYYYELQSSPTLSKGFRAHAKDGPNIYTSYPSFFTQDFHVSNRVSINAGEGSSGVNDASYNMSDHPADQWIRLEYWFQHSSSGGTADGQIRAWRNLSNIEDSQGIITLDSGVTDLFKLAMLPFLFGDSGEGWGWYNDVYLSNTQARVEIGNNSVFASCTIREIQNPSAWSNTSITFTVNQGTLSIGTNYVFTVDSSGSATQQGEIEIA